MNTTSNQNSAGETLPARKLTLTQSENLRIGQRGGYLPTNPNGPFAQRAERLGIKCWVEKRRKAVTKQDRNLRTFIDIPCGYELIYGITYNGKDYECGDMPRDLGTVAKGIEIAIA